MFVCVVHMCMRMRVRVCVRVRVRVRVHVRVHAYVCMPYHMHKRCSKNNPTITAHTFDLACTCQVYSSQIVAFLLAHIHTFIHALTLTRTENRGEAAHFAGAGACKHTRCVCSAARSNYEYARWYAAGSHRALHCPLYRSTGMCVCACVCTWMFACMCICERACASVVYYVCASVVYCLLDLLRNLRSSTLVA